MYYHTHWTHTHSRSLAEFLCSYTAQLWNQLPSSLQVSMTWTVWICYFKRPINKFLKSQALYLYLRYFECRPVKNPYFRLWFSAHPSYWLYAHKHVKKLMDCILTMFKAFSVQRGEKWSVFCKNRCGIAETAANNTFEIPGVEELWAGRHAFSICASKHFCSSFL